MIGIITIIRCSSKIGIEIADIKNSVNKEIVSGIIKYFILKLDIIALPVLFHNFPVFSRNVFAALANIT
jgi:hypothetical protein